MRLSPTRIALLLLVAAASSACSLLFGFDGFDDAGANGGADASDDGATADGTGGGGDGPTTGRDGDPDEPDAFVAIPCGEAGSAICLPPPPSQWAGPVILFEGALDAGMPTCPGADLPKVKGFIGLDAGPATCTPCSCGTTSTSCGSVQAIPGVLFGGCSGNGTDLPPGECVSLAGFSFYPGIQITDAKPSAKCTASGGDASVPTATWSSAGGACNAVEVPGTACPSGNICHLVPPEGFTAGKFCVWAQSSFQQQQCPRQTYTERHVIADGTLNDDRGCKCDCEASGGACDSSGVQVSLYGQFNCGGTATDVLTAPHACTTPATTPKAAQVNQAAVVSTPPTCAPTPGSGDPSGSARPQKSWIVCCTP
jgi:hypothetical protein